MAGPIMLDNATDLLQQVRQIQIPSGQKLSSEVKSRGRLDIMFNLSYGNKL